MDCLWMNGCVSTIFNCLLHEQKQWHGWVAVERCQPAQNVIELLKMRWSFLAQNVTYMKRIRESSNCDFLFQYEIILHFRRQLQIKFWYWVKVYKIQFLYDSIIKNHGSCYQTFYLLCCVYGKVFWCFQGVEKGYIGNKWVNACPAKGLKPCLKLKF